MKQIAKRCMLLWMLSLLLICPAMAEEAPKEEDAWYAFSAENTVVTVRLPSNTKTGLVWEYEISAPEIMELITGETIVGPGEGMAGAPTTYVASFRSIGSEGGHVSLIFRLMDSSAEAPVKTRVLEMELTPDGKLLPCSVLTQDPFADWCEVNLDDDTVTVALPMDEEGGAWQAGVLDEGMLTPESEDVQAGMYTAIFRSANRPAEDVELSFRFTNAQGIVDRTRSVYLIVREDGSLWIKRAEAFDMLDPAA